MEGFSIIISCTIYRIILYANNENNGIINSSWFAGHSQRHPFTARAVWKTELNFWTDTHPSRQSKEID